MVTVLALLGVLAVLFAAAVLATRDGQVLADAPPDAADVALPEEPLQPDDLSRLRFSLAARGYRMSEVDLALARLATELADRDRRIALLEAAVQGERPAAAADAPVREAGPTDLPVAEAAPVASVPAAPAPVASVPAAPASMPPPPPVVTPAPTAVVPPAPAAPVAPAPSVPSALAEPAETTDPDPLPPADLGAELVTQERVEQGAADQQPQGHEVSQDAQNPSWTGSPAVVPSDEPAAVEETGDRPHQP